MKIAVCDDSLHDLAQIRSAFDRIKDRFEIEARYFQSGEEMLSAAESGEDFALAVLDIYMNEQNGINAAKRLKELLPRVQTAFLTSSAEFALEAFDLGALHYIVKPVSAEKLLELMERFCARTRFAAKNLEIKSKTKVYTFPIISVQKIMSGGKGADVCLKNGGVVHISESFASVEKQLDSSIFLRISRGFIVNMSYILFMNNEICRFRDGTETLISRREKNEIRRRYNDFLFEGQEDIYDSL